MPTRYLLLILLLPALILAAACGDDDDDDDTNGEPTEAGDGNGGDGDLVGVASLEGFGDVLVDGEGFTLYIFTNDSAGTSACNDSCAATWPPLTTDAGDVTAPEGADGEFTLIERDDGTMQVAYEGRPLYRYAADTAPGQATGEGVGGVWFVAEADPDASALPSDGTNASVADTQDDGYYD